MSTKLWAVVLAFTFVCGSALSADLSKHRIRRHRNYEWLTTMTGDGVPDVPPPMDNPLDNDDPLNNDPDVPEPPILPPNPPPVPGPPDVPPPPDDVPPPPPGTARLHIYTINTFYSRGHKRIFGDPVATIWEPETVIAHVGDLLYMANGDLAKNEDDSAKLGVALGPEFLVGARNQPRWTYAKWHEFLDRLAVLSAEFPHFVLAPGTVVFSDIQEDPPAKGNGLLSKRRVRSRAEYFYNCMPVAYNGAIVHRHCKHFDGGSMGAAQEAEGIVTRTEFNWNRPIPPENIVVDNAAGHFTIDVTPSVPAAAQLLKVGVEICADHNENVLKTAVELAYPNPNDRPHLQLSPFNPGRVQRTHVSTRPGGIVVEHNNMGGDTRRGLTCGLVSTYKPNDPETFPAIGVPQQMCHSMLFRLPTTVDVRLF